MVPRAMRDLMHTSWCDMPPTFRHSLRMMWADSLPESLPVAFVAIVEKPRVVAPFFLLGVANDMGESPVVVAPEDANFAAFWLRSTDHGSPLWRLLVCIASGKVTREDLRILAEVVEALADG